MEDGENSVIGRNVRFLVEVENKKEFVHATILLHHMTAMIAQLTDQTVLKPENVTKIPVQVVISKYTNISIKFNATVLN